MWKITITFRNCLCSVSRRSSKNNSRRLVECVNMPYMFKVSHSFIVTLPNHTCNMYDFNYSYIKWRLCASRHPRSPIHNLVPQNWLFGSHTVPLILMCFYYFLMKMKIISLCILISCHSANLASWGQDPRVPGAVSELCHP